MYERHHALHNDNEFFAHSARRETLRKGRSSGCHEFRETKKSKDAHVLTTNNIYKQGKGFAKPHCS